MESTLPKLSSVSRPQSCKIKQMGNRSLPIESPGCVRYYGTQYWVPAKKDMPLRGCWVFPFFILSRIEGTFFALDSLDPRKTTPFLGYVWVSRASRPRPLEQGERVFVKRLVWKRPLNRAVRFQICQKLKTFRGRTSATPLLKAEKDPKTQGTGWQEPPRNPNLHTFAGTGWLVTTF